MELKILQEKMNCQLHKEREWKLRQARQKEFEGSNKPGKLMAWQVQKKRQKNSIIKIKETGKEIGEQQTIKRVFYNYYSNLPKGKPKDMIKMTNYLREVKLTKVPNFMKDTVNTEITL